MSPREELARLIYTSVIHVFEESCEPNPNDYLPAADEWLSRHPIKIEVAWVLQRNDFPHTVYFNETEARAECARQRAIDKQWREDNAHVADVRTYWNVYKVDKVL